MTNETKHTETVVLSDGTRDLIVGQTLEGVVLTEAGQEFAKTTRLLQTRDGRTITDPTKQTIYGACSDCKEGPFAAEAVQFCTKDQAVLCRRCAKEFDNQVLCAACYQRAKRSALWEFFTSL